MATLYWGGGTGTWNDTSTANWYTNFARTTLSTRTPCAEDDVIFDSSSNATGYTVTVSGGRTVCRSCTISGPASGSLTLAGVNTWYIYGDLTLPATGLTRTFTGPINFWGAGNYSITTNGVALASTITFAGGGKYTLQDALNNSSSSITIGSTSAITPGAEFDTNGKTVTCGTFSTNGSVGTVITLGASTVTCSAFTPSANVVLNAGTSTINISSAGLGSSTFTGATFYNVNFTSTTYDVNQIYGSNTFNNLTFSTPTTARMLSCRLHGNQTVNGTLTISGQSAVNRHCLFSGTVGVTRTLTVAAVSSLTDIDFRDITVAGASAPWSGTRLGDCGGNSNVTFGAGTNKYIAAGTATSAITDNIWATSSGGSAVTNNFPLAQDTIIIDNAGLNTSATLTFGSNRYNFGPLDVSSRTNAMTLGLGSGSVNFYGDITLSSSITFSGGIYCSGRGTQNIDTAGKTMTGSLSVGCPSGVVKLAADISLGSNSIQLSAGTFDANNKNITAQNIQLEGSLSKTLTLGSGTITLTDGIYTVSSDGAPNTTFTANTATIVISSTGANLGVSASSSSFGGSISATSANAGLRINGNVTVGNLTLTAPTASASTTKLTLAGDLTVTGTLALAGGTSATQRAAVLSNAIGTQRTLSAATVTGLTDIDFRDINATGAANWTSGTRLGDCGGNAGITFPAAKTVYWNLAGAQNWSATAWATSSGGTPAVNNFPLAQDTAVFDDTGSAGTVTIQAFNIGTISAGSRTSAWTLAGSAAVNIYGNVTYGSGTTPSATSSLTFSGTGTQTFTTAGKTVTLNVLIDKPSGVFQHGDAFIGGSGSGVYVNRGDYNTQNYNITCLLFSSAPTNTRSITLGTSTLTLSTNISPITIAPANLTFSAASSTILLSNTSSRTFNGGGLTYGTLSSTGGTGAGSELTITGSNTFAALTNTAYTNLILTSGTTQTVTTMSYSGASGSLVRVHSSAPGQRASLNLTSNAIGANSVDNGNNSGFSFTGSSPDYLSLRDIQYVSPLVPSGFFMFF